MKEIKAYIKANKQDEVTRALHQIDGLSGASFSEVLGFGSSKAASHGYNPNRDPSGYVRHVKVEVVCEDTLVDEVVRTLHRAAHTGLCGDGRIYVSGVDREIRIQEAPR